MDLPEPTNTGAVCGTFPAYLPLLTDGEMLFSLAARYHRLSGNACAKQTSIQLFGDSRAGLRHDFPSHLDQFVKITQGQIGNAETLAYERTVFGFFAPFQDAKGAASVLAKMRSDSVEKVKSALGLLPSRLGGFFPLKACPDCIRDDLKEYSVSRWHLEHQWPSVWICRKHRKMLQQLNREFQPRDLRQWLLPEDIVQEHWSVLEISSQAIRAKLLWIAELSARFAQTRCRNFDQHLLRYAYLLRAKERGWLLTNGALKLALVRQMFLKFYCGMEEVPGFEIIQSVHAENGGMLGLLMRQYDCRRHPLKHILLIGFLFESVSEFDVTYEQACQEYANGGSVALESMIGDEWKAEIKRLVEVAHRSLSSAALTIGIPLCVAIRIAKQSGIEYQRRTRVVNTSLEAKLRKMITDGLAREEILRETGIKKSLLRDFMAREPALRDAWRKQDFERRKDSYRANFLALIKRFTGVSVKKLRTVSGNGVSWLYRNDRKWLSDNLPCR